MDAARSLCGPAIVFFLIAGPAVAAQPSREATAAQNEGVRAYDAGRYQEALDRFQLSYTLSPQPALLLAIARSAYKLRDTDRAKACLFDFLRDDPKSLSASEAFELLTKIEKESPATAKSAEARCLHPEKAKPPEVAAGEAAKPAPVKPPEAVPSPWTTQTAPAPAREAKKHGPWSYVAMGTAVAAAGLATYFGTRNLSATSDWRNATTPQATADARDRARSAATNANIAWAAAAALAGTGLGLYFFTEF